MKALLVAILMGSLCVACQNKNESKESAAKTANASPTAAPSTPPTKNAAAVQPGQAGSTPTTSSTPATSAAAGNQWFCYKMDNLGECHTSLALCQSKRRAEARILVKRSMNPLGLGPCTPQSDAVCFTYNKPAYKVPKAKCNRDVKSCAAMHTLYKQQWPNLALTECEKTGAWQSGAKPAAPAPAK